MILFRRLALFFLALCYLSCQTGDTPPLEELTIAQAHTAFQEGTLSSEKLVQAYLERIEQYDPQLNSLTFLNPKALEEAKALDQELAKTGVLRPLHGIPLIVKDNINTAEMPTTAGALALQHFIPERDAFIIERLKDAGAIILGKSNMAEWAFSPMHTESSTAGTTHNPYDTTRVPAGSSGGTGGA
ncbi:MAG TPA: amidase, partial [Cytophagales bacterium]|nr:amidase [Cytophagales bacterium]